MTLLLMFVRPDYSFFVTKSIFPVDDSLIKDAHEANKWKMRYPKRKLRQQ